MSGTLELLIEALNANTAAILGQQKTAAPAADKTTAGKTTAAKGTAAKDKAAPAKPKHNKAETTEAIVALKDTVGVDAAKALLGEHGFKKVADITEDKFDVLFDSATEQLEAFKAENTGDSEGEDDI